MTEAKATVGVTARAAGYDVRPEEQNEFPGVIGRPTVAHPYWVARQTIELRADGGDRLLPLVGKLQEAGFTVEAMDWRLSTEFERLARDATKIAALKIL